MQAPSVRARVAGVLVVASTLVLAACSSSPSHPASSPSRHGSTTTTFEHSIPPSPTTATLPSASASGSLARYASVPVSTNPGELAAAEAPDGAVFVAQLALAALGAGPQIVWVVDGDSPAAVAETLTDGVASLAADATNLYVGNYDDVTAFTRSTGNQSGMWALPPISTTNTSDNNLEAMSASGGSVLVSIGQGDAVSVYRINPQSTAVPVLIAQGSSAAFGPDGSVYYVRSDHHLVEQSASGVITVGPTLADTPNGLGGGVQYIDTVAGGDVWVGEPAGQGLDSGYTTYDAKTLHFIARFSGTVELQVASTQAGALALNGPGACPQPTSASVSTMCVSRIAANGTSSDLLPVGTALQLLGPYPVVIGADADNTALQVERVK